MNKATTRPIVNISIDYVTELEAEVEQLKDEIATCLDFCRLCTEVGFRKGDRLIDYISALHESARAARALLNEKP